MRNIDLHTEANVLSHYLISENCPDDTVIRFADALLLQSEPLSEKQIEWYSRAIKYPFLMPILDGGLALVNRSSPVRKRIFIMLCLLECDPRFVNRFLPLNRSWWYLIVAGWNAAWAVVGAIVGACLIKFFSIE